MDLRLYFQQLGEVEQNIETPEVVIASLQTADGGRAGVLSTVSRTVAAKLIVEGRARRATDSEVKEYRSRIDRAVARAEEERLSGRVQVTLVSDQDVRAGKSSGRPLRG